MSPYGALNLSGNVWEWVADWYQADYYLHSPADNPLGPANGSPEHYMDGQMGFSCAMD